MTHRINTEVEGNKLNKKVNLVVNLFVPAILFLALQVAAFGQNKFDGYLRNTENYTSQAVSLSATVAVYNQGGLAAGTTLATNLRDCTTNALISNPFNVTTGYFCFDGSAASYDVEVSTDAMKKRRVVSEQTRTTRGVYRITDFGAVDNSTLSTADNTYALKSAMAYIGTRGEIGGKLIVPNGVYKVANTNTQATLPIIIPPGLTFEGLNGKGNFGSSRIQMDIGSQTMFKIGNNTDRVTFRDLSLVVPLNACGGSFCSGTKAIRGEVDDNKASQMFLASSVNIQGFEEGFSFSGSPGSNNDGQFGSARIENSTVGDTLYPVRLNAQNAEFDISNSVFLTIKHSSLPEAAIRIDKVGPLTLTKVYGGVAYRDVNNKPLAFILVKGRHGPITIKECESENTEHSFLYDYNPVVGDVRPPIIFNSAFFGDLVVFKGNVNFTSSGSNYSSNGVQFWGTPKGGASTQSEISSYGDKFAELTHKLYVCPEAAGVQQIYFPPERPNGDFHRLTVSDITPVTGSPDKNVCRRDFYLYNAPGETNRVVIRTAQRKYSVGDSDSLGSTKSETSVDITAPPVFDDYISTRPGIDRFKTWGYRIERNSTSGSLDFLGNQKPPNFENNHSFFRFNGAIYPTEDGVYELGNGSARWALVRGVTVVSGDTILSDKKTGKELYKIHEDDNFIYFSDIRTGKILMRVDTQGNLYVAGKIVENAPPESKENGATENQPKPMPDKKKKNR